MTKLQAFLKGSKTLFNPMPHIRNPYEDENGNIKSTEEMIHEHWKAVGNYLHQAMSDFDHEQKQKAKK